MDSDDNNIRYEFKNNGEYEKNRIRRTSEYLNEVGSISIELNRGQDAIKEKNIENEKKEK